MIIYWILFLIPLTISVLPDKLNIKLNNQLILLYGIICTLFIGFRYQIGGDWGIYDNWARLINTIDFISVFNMFSPGYNMMVWISVNLGFGVLLSNIICALLFIIGLTFVFVIKNETRNLEKEIGNLEASINSLKFDLHQTRLEHEFITTPQNISKLAKEHLESNLNPYKKSQIKDLNKKSKPTAGNLKEKKEKKLTTKNKKVSEKIKIEVAKKIEKKKTDLKKLQKLYSEPEKLPIEIKTQVAKTIEIKSATKCI